MKKMIFALFGVLYFLGANAADLYVNGSGNENTYPTIQEAVNAASSGDNIYVATVGTYSEDVTISNKSLFIVASVADEQFTLSGSFTLNPGVGNEVSIVGMYNGNVTTGSSSSGTVNLISSFISSISNNSGNLVMNVYDCEVTNNFTINNGSVKGCNILGGLTINNDNNATGDTIRIMGNHIENALTWNSSSAYFEICNNYIEGNTNFIYSSYYNAGLKVSARQTTPGGTNLIANNTIITNISTSGPSNYSQSSYQPHGILFTGNSDGQNLVVANNYIKTSSNSSYNVCAIFSSSSMNDALIANNYWFSVGSFSGNFTGSSLVDNGTTSVNWSYDSTTGELTNGQNQGIDQIEYRDIDNTINDIGTSGGPHAWSNYNTTEGKAAIFNLELPSQLYIGGNHNIKAKAFHKN